MRLMTIVNIPDRLKTHHYVQRLAIIRDILFSDVVGAEFGLIGGRCVDMMQFALNESLSDSFCRNCVMRLWFVR